MPAPADIKARFARVLRTRRESLHLTQEEAAHRCRLNVRYFRALEAGKSVPGLDTLDRILGGMDWSWHDLADQLAPKVSGAGASGALHRLLDAGFASGSARDRDTLAAILDVYGKKRKR